ncbi:pyrroline-5-carboxylate reductase [Methylocella sp.]|uniref:pyrroline-5-carboxylate reductase n=1 Tax=Methylocella sp. TaxID=1978226 RepID=UPI00378379F1
MTESVRRAAPAFPSAVLLAGAGKMGGAMARGWLAAGLAPQALRVVEPRPSPELEALARAHGFALLDAPPWDGAPDVLVLAIKPQALDEARAFAPLAGERAVVLSILAGKSVADVAARLPDAGAVVRAMPNLPAAVGRGMTGLYCATALDPARRIEIETLIGATGAFEWLADEALMDAVTAVSGSGPAYVFYLVECLARAGEAQGLAPEAAARLARATIEGAGELLRLSPDSPASTLRENVTSPGGTTAAALKVLMADDGLEPLMRRAVEAARRRATELAG